MNYLLSISFRPLEYCKRSQPCGGLYNTQLHIYTNFRPGGRFPSLSAANKQCCFGILLITFAYIETRGVLYCPPGKGASTIGMFKEALTKHNGDPQGIKELSMDMSPAFISGSAEYLPQAEVTFDKFHVIKLLNEALDKVHRTEE